MEPTTPKATALPALGAEITIGETHYRVHPNCKAARDKFESFLRRRALEIIDEMFREKTITAEEREVRRAAAFHDFESQRFAYGTQAYVDASYTDAGVKKHIEIRVGLANPKDVPHPDAIAEWVDANGLRDALAVMNAADANCPKSSSPAEMPNSGESSSATST